MQKIRLTDAYVKGATVPEGRKEVTIWDADVSGFGLRLRGASKTYVLFYRPAGMGRAANSKRLKLGTPESLPSVKEARRLAREALGRVAAGADPAAERAEAKRRETSSVSDLLGRYDEYLKRRGHVCPQLIMSALRRRLKPHMSRDVAEIKGYEYAEIIERLEKAGLPGAAKGFRSHCSTFLNWCAFDARAIDANPLAGFRRGRNTRQEKVKRETYGRALSDEELRAVWTAAGPDTAFGRLVRFLILTGCRRSEAAGLNRAMIDKDAGRIDLPATFTKQARGHTLYIGPQLDDVLKACPVDARNPTLVFAAPRTGGPMSGWSKYMDANGKRADCKTVGLVPRSGVRFSLHDLRRTFRTGLSRLGVETEIAELALGHARADLEARYNRDDCAELVRAAFLAWDRHLSSLLAPQAE